jgi:hypothetical protein
MRRKVRVMWEVMCKSTAGLVSEIHRKYMVVVDGQKDCRGTLLNNLGGEGPLGLCLLSDYVLLTSPPSHCDGAIWGQ